MDGDQPFDGQWNFDNDNRKPPKAGLDIPQTYLSAPDLITNEVLKVVDKSFPDHFGDLYPFNFAVTREQALEALEEFISRRLQNFGTYQDAMVEGEPWMFHSHISFYLNSGLLNPLECIKQAEEAYHRGFAPINAVEGFIRQILGGENLSEVFIG
jgi:deoxyribodipyrimidine photolyase-related protein